MGWPAPHSGWALTRRAGLVAALVAIVLLAAGCGGGGSTTSTSHTDEQPPKVVPTRSAQSALQRLWRWTSIGSPAAITGYDAALVDGVGRQEMIEALRTLGGQLKQAPPRVTSVSNTPLGTQVVVRQTQKGNPPIITVYLLRREKGDWLVTYDGAVSRSLMENATHAATTRAQNKINRKAKMPSAAAQSVGAAAGLRAQDDTFAAITGPTAPAPGATHARTPRVALRQLWTEISNGSPLAITAYDRKFVRKIGAVELLGALQAMRQIFTTTPTRITKIEGTKLGTLVTVRQKPKENPATESSYLLDRRSGNWIVVFDGILNGQLVAVATRSATDRVQRKINPNAKQPSAQAQAAGAAAGQKVQRQLNKLVPSSLKDRLNPPPGS